MDDLPIQAQLDELYEEVEDIKILIGEVQAKKDVSDKFVADVINQIVPQKKRREMLIKVIKEYSIKPKKAKIKELLWDMPDYEYSTERVAFRISQGEKEVINVDKVKEFINELSELKEVSYESLIGSAFSKEDTFRISEIKPRIAKPKELDFNVVE